MYLYLVRHGQSVGNERQLFFGHSDHPLTELGREQAKQAADKLREVEFTRCLSSDLSRAWDTALICTEGRGVAPEPCPALREQDLGALEDLSWAQAEKLYGGPVGRMLSDWFNTPPPEGESPSHMLERVGGCVDEIVRRGDDTLIVAHNGSLSLILYHLGLIEEKDLMQQNWYFHHGTYTAIEIAGGAARLAVFNR